MVDAKAMPGAKDLILWCNSHKLPMALVTSSSSSSVDFKSRSNSWLKLIKTRVYGDDISLKRGKPAPDPYILAAEKLSTNPMSCWAVEDSYSGTKSASLAGCQVWVLDPEHNLEMKKIPTEKLSKPQPIKSLKEFLSELKNSKDNN